MTESPTERPVVSIFVDDLDHPEGVAVAPDGGLWAGGEDGQIYVVTPDGHSVEHARTGGFSGGLAFDAAGDCFVCNTSGRIVRVTPAGAWETFADSAGGLPLRVPNFPVFGSDGSLYVSDSGSWETADGTICRFLPDGTGEIFHAGPFHFANGLAIDAAGEFLYVVETGRHSVVRLRISDGAAAVPEDVCPPNSLEWVPDGLAFDSTGDLYVTVYGSDRIVRVDAQGSLTVIVEDPHGIILNRPTNCAFGGPDLGLLYIANLGGRHIAVVDIGRRGQILHGGPRA